MGRQPMGQSGASTANAGAQAGRIGAGVTPRAMRDPSRMLDPGELRPTSAPPSGPPPALSQAVPAGGWAQTAPLRNTYRMGGGGMAMGSFMALPREILQLTSGINPLTGGLNAIQGAQWAGPTEAAPASAQPQPTGTPAAPATGAPPATAPTYKTRQELGAINGVVGTWTDENGVTHQTVQDKNGVIYADTARGFRPLSQAEIDAQPGSDIEVASQTDAPEAAAGGLNGAPLDPDNLWAGFDPFTADIDALISELALLELSNSPYDYPRMEALRGQIAAAQYEQRATRGVKNQEGVQYAAGESPEERAAARQGGTASSSAGLSAAAGTPPPVQTSNRVERGAPPAPAGGSNAALSGAPTAPATATAAPAAAAPADNAQARRDYWRANGRQVQAGLPRGWKSTDKGVWDSSGNFRTWDDIATGNVPKVGEEEDDLAWSNAQAFAQRMVGETQTGPNASDKLREDILAPLPETPRMSQEERQRQLQGIDLGLRQQAANRARAMMQGGGFANAESQAGVMAEMGLQNDANITQQRSARELAFALDDLSAERQDHANRLAQIQQAIALSTNDYERQQLLTMQRELMRSQSGIEATMAAYQRQLSKPDLGESLMGLFGGAIGGLLTAPIGGIGMGLGSGLGNAIGGAISGPDPYLEYLKSLRR